MKRFTHQTQPDLYAAARTGRFLVVSDRLPIVLTREEGNPENDWKAAPAHGALISALSPVLRDRRGVWIGWPGVSEEEVPGLRKVLAGGIQGGGYSLRPVSLSEEEQRGCYAGFGREVIWPLFHDLPGLCAFDPSCWQAYRKVNRKFARAIARVASRNGAGTDFVWVHNHLLMHVAAELRQLGAVCRTAFFLHLPFPSPDMLRKLPWRRRLLRGLLAFDQLGFQTRRDLGNFLDCVRELVPGARLSRSGAGWSVQGETAPSPGSSSVPCDVRAGAFPVGIDALGFAQRAARPEVEARMAALRTALRGRRIVLGVDHLDRTQGIVEKLRAFARALELRPALQEQVTLVQVVVPSRENIQSHMELRSEIERLVGEINGRFSRPGWVPVHYLYRLLAPDELLAHYRAADVALVTPLKEGMSLMAKEYCAANLEEQGALVLSEFAGAAAQLGRGALRVHPYDIHATARALLRALDLTPEERALRMRSLRDEVQRHDVFWWVESFLAAAGTAGAADSFRHDLHDAGTGLQSGLQSGLHSYN